MTAAQQRTIGGVPVEAAPRCPLCGNGTVAVMHAHDRNQRLSAETFAYAQCPRCRSLSLLNVPSDLGRYYPRAYYDVPTTLAALDARTAGDRYKVALIRQWIPTGRLIEIGPAYGMFARVAQLAGFQVETIEMDERCCAFLRDVVGVAVTQSDDVARALGGLAAADVIAMWHVLEHLPDPWEVMAAAAARLRPGGILVIATPNPGAMQFQLFGSLWTHLDAPRHLHLLSADLVAERGRALGLDTVCITMTDPGGIGWNSFGWAATLRNFFRVPVLRRLAYLGGRVVSKVAAPIERSGARGSAYTIVLRRAVTER